MLIYCLKFKRKTKSEDEKIIKTKNGRLVLSSKCVFSGSKKSRFMNEQEAEGLLGNLGIKTLLNKIPLLNIPF